MTLPTITGPGATPNRSTDTAAAFASNADIFVAWMAGLPDEFATYAVDLIDAAASANYSATSTTSNSVSLGSKAFTIETGKLFVPGQPVVVSDSADPTVNQMFGIVETYNISTGALVVDATVANGAGTKASWFIGLTGEKGATGDPDAGGVDTQTFTASGTWTKPTNAARVIVECLGAGGGGGSGSKGTNTSNNWGGAGGGGGAFIRMEFDASDLAASVAVTIGAGGAGGTAVTNTTPGNAGSAGGDTTFGSYLTCYGGGGGGGGASTASGGRGGGLLSAGATGSGGEPVPSGSTGIINGTDGSGINFNTADPMQGAASVRGGGCGGGIQGNASGAGGCSVYGGGGGGAGGVGATHDDASAGGSRAGLSGGGGAAGVSDSTAPTAGSDGSTIGYGGGAGGSGNTAGGAAGGDGGIGGGGGGGGGTVSAVNPTGAGGAGGSGWCRVTTILSGV